MTDTAEQGTTLAMAQATIYVPDAVGEKLLAALDAPGILAP